MPFEITFDSNESLDANFEGDSPMDAQFHEAIIIHGEGSVDSVNGKTGVVVLDADDVGAIPAPSTPSDGDVLTYDSDSGEWVAEAPGGGGGGTSDYTDLTNKPSIESVTLSGNKTAADLGLAKATDIPTVPSAYTSTPAALGTASAGSSTKWARGDHVHAKPTYSKSDVGLGNVDNVQQYSASNPPPYPVTSVNGSTGAVTVSVPSAATSAPSDLGTAAVGSSSKYAREDHVHNSELTDDIRDALIQLAEKVAYIDNGGDDYYSDLVNALYPIQSISAVYTQSGAVYPDDSLDVLKTNLVVTATLENGSTKTIPSTKYTLSGTLTTGTSTITVTYLDKTTTFTVTVTAPLYSVADFAQTTLNNITISKQNGVINMSGKGTGVIYIYPNGTVNASKSNTLWFELTQECEISSKIIDCTWSNPNTENVELAYKYAKSNESGNIATAAMIMTAGSSGTEGTAEYYNAAYPSGRKFSCIAVQFNHTTGSGTYAQTISATFQYRLFIDGVRYL